MDSEHSTLAHLESGSMEPGVPLHTDVSGDQGRVPPPIGGILVIMIHVTSEPTRYDPPQTVMKVTPDKIS